MPPVPSQQLVLIESPIDFSMQLEISWTFAKYRTKNDFYSIIFFFSSELLCACVYVSVFCMNEFDFFVVVN